MALISEQTATDIAMAYRELKVAEELLQKVDEVVGSQNFTDFRDAFGRPRGLQLGVPSGRDSHRLFDVPWKLARPIIEASIAEMKSKIEILSQKAGTEYHTPVISDESQ